MVDPNTTRSDLVDILNGFLTTPTGCWSDYNRKFKLWRSLKRIEWPDGIIKPDETAQQPSVDDYADNDC